jgi:HD-GYP domain-containing protein (c-di-GMP phosphodiesterase class II)
LVGSCAITNKNLKTDTAKEKVRFFKNIYLPYNRSGLGLKKRMVGTVILVICIVSLFLFLIFIGAQRKIITGKNHELEIFTKLMATYLNDNISAKLEALKKVVEAKKFYITLYTHQDAEALGDTRFIEDKQVFDKTHFIKEETLFNQGIFFVNASGFVLNPSEHKAHVLIEDVTQYIRHNEMLKEKEPRIFDIDLQEKNIYVVVILYPFYNVSEGSKEFAVGVFDQKDSFFEKEIRATVWNLKGYVNIVNNKGKIIFSTKQEKLYKITSRSELIKLSQSSGEIVIERDKIEETIVAVTSIPLLSWHLIVARDTKDYYSGVTDLKKSLLYLATILAAVVITFTLIVSTVLVNPLVSLSKEVSEIAKGNLEKPIVSRGPGEVGILSDSMEKMRKSLKTYIKREKEYQAELENKVKEKTVDLKNEITIRKQKEVELQTTLNKLRMSLRETINVLASTVERKDPYTSGHQRRVADLACAIAPAMGLSREQIDGLRMAGTIHDLGKISIPAEILSKPGKLIEIEFNLIKTHPQIGYDILREVEFPWPIAQIVFQHHERMDGSGYPSGLSGEDILLEARILAVADVVEAMAFHRPYRPALGLDKALEEISKNRDVFYDLKVVNACLELFIEKGFNFKNEY